MELPSDTAIERILAGIAALGAGLLWIRTKLSRDNKDIKVDLAEVSLMEHLQKRLFAAEATAERAWSERNAAATENGALRAENAYLKETIKRLEARVAALERHSGINLDDGDVTQRPPM